MSIADRDVRACRALATIHLTRVKGTAWASAIAVLVMASIDIVRHGLSIDTTIPWLLGASIMIPLAPGFAIIKEKSDGSLRYYSSLPVRGQVHAMARVVTSIATSLLAACVATLAVSLTFPTHSPVIVLGTFASTLLGLTSVSLAIVAMQLRVSVGQGAKRIVYGMSATVVGMQLFSVAQDRGLLERAKPMLFTREGMIVSGIAFGVLIGTVAAISIRSIARSSVSYKSEPAAP